MTEETKEVEMYYYIVNGKKLWTSNEFFARLRAEFHGSNLIYIEKVKIEIF